MTRGPVSGSGLRSTRKPAGKGAFLFALPMLLAWLCALPWILVDSDMPLSTSPPVLADPTPSE